MHILCCLNFFLLPFITPSSNELNLLMIFRCSPITKISNLEIYRGSYMTAHVLLNLLNELQKRYDVSLCQAVLPNVLNKFNNTEA